jgi:suppressor for copper-sensitivity B
LSRGTGEIIIVFAALGVGMAVPFLAVAAVPSLATRLPRPGPWMIRLKRVLALALAATAVWLLSVLAAQESTIAALAVAALMVLAALLLALRRSVFAAISRQTAALVAVVGLIAFAVPGAVSSLGLADPERKIAATTARADWRPFDRDAITGLVASGKTVFVDVTADWCITCQVNKSRVLDVGAVSAALDDDRVVRMRADWTSPDPAIARYLASFGRYGIPFDVVYGPTSPGGIVLPELLTQSAVLDALAAADRNRTVAGR